MSSNPQTTIGVTAVDKASGVLRSLDQQVLGTTQKIDQSSEKAAKTTEKASKSMIKSYAGIAGSVASLGAGIVSFTTSFSNLEKAEYRVNQASLMLDKAQAKLDKMYKEGKVSAEEYARQQEDVAVKTQQLKIYQDDLGDSYTNFYAQIPAQLLSFGTSAVMAYTAYTTAAGAGTTATHGLRAAMVAAFMSPPFIGAIIAGVATVAILLATNVGGIRDAFVSAGKAVHEFINQYFKPLGDLITWVIDGLNALGAGLNVGVTPAYADAGEATGAFANETLNAGYAVIATAKEIQTYDEYLQELHDSTVKARKENEHYIMSQNDLYEVSKMNNDELQLLADHLQDQQRELQRTQQENFSLVASVHSVDEALKALRNGSLAQVADGLREIEDNATKASNAMSNLQSATGAGSRVEAGTSSNISNWWQGRRSDSQRALDAARALDAGVSATQVVRDASKGGVNVTINDYGDHYEVNVNGTIRRMQARRRSVIA